MEGALKFFNEMKNYGFIEVQDKDYFVHGSDLKEGVHITEGDAVVFDVEETPRGPKAINVSKKTE